MNKRDKREIARRLVRIAKMLTAKLRWKKVNSREWRVVTNKWTYNVIRIGKDFVLDIWDTKDGPEEGWLMNGKYDSLEEAQTEAENYG
jgi:hypothetical protein